MKSIEIEYGSGLGVDENRIGDWSQTWTGRRFYFLDPRPEDIDILDIFHAICHISRYTGHCAFYSVAEHSILVSKLVPEEYALVALAHDFCEAYVMDMSRPLKRAMGKDNNYFELEQNIWEKAIAPKFGLPSKLPQCVIDADSQIMVLEKAALHPRSSCWYLPFDMPKGIKLELYTPNEVMYRLIDRYCDITHERSEPLHTRAMKLKLQDLYSLKLYGDQSE